MDILKGHIFNPNKTGNAQFLCKFHELTEQNIVETKGVSVNAIRMKQSFKLYS